VHEMSIACELYRLCREELVTRNGSRICEVHVAVGELAGVEPDLLQFAWQALVAEGSDMGAKLEISWHPVTQRCLECGEVAERQPGSWLRLCPTCSEPLELEGGRELDLVSLAFETEEQSGGATVTSSSRFETREEPR